MRSASAQREPPVEAGWEEYHRFIRYDAAVTRIRRDLQDLARRVDHLRHPQDRRRAHQALGELQDELDEYKAKLRYWKRRLDGRRAAFRQATLPGNLLEEVDFSEPVVTRTSDGEEFCGTLEQTSWLNGRPPGEVLRYIYREMDSSEKLSPSNSQLLVHEWREHFTPAPDLDFGLWFVRTCELYIRLLSARVSLVYGVSPYREVLNFLDAYAIAFSHDDIAEVNRQTEFTAKRFLKWADDLAWRKLNVDLKLLVKQEARVNVKREEAEMQLERRLVPVESSRSRSRR